MIAFPEVQRRAQNELDTVVGRDRPPTFADAPCLPYACAVIKEVLRWRPAVPIGVPHAATEDDGTRACSFRKALCVYRIPGTAIMTARYLAKTRRNSGQSDTWTSKGNCCPALQKLIIQDMSRSDLGDASAWERSWPLTRSSSTQHACCGQQISSGREIKMVRRCRWTRTHS